MVCFQQSTCLPEGETDVLAPHTGRIKNSRGINPPLLELIQVLSQQNYVSENDRLIQAGCPAWMHLERNRDSLGVMRPVPALDHSTLRD